MRVQDLLPLRYTRVRAEDYAQIKEVFPAGADMAYRAQWPTLTNDPAFESSIEEIEKADPFLAITFRYLDRKLDRVLDWLRTLSQERLLADFPSMPVELSGSGMCFDADEPFHPGDIVKIQLYLTGNIHSLLTFYAKVVRVEGGPPAPYHLFLEHDLIQEDDREQIVRYIFYKEREKLKVRRQDPSMPPLDE